MKTLRLTVDLEYDDGMWHQDDEELDWFLGTVLTDDLVLHSNEVGDSVGIVRVVEVHGIPQQEDTP